MALPNLKNIMTPSTSTTSPQTTLACSKDKYLEDFHFPFCEDATKFEKMAKIGQGTFG